MFAPLQSRSSTDFGGVGGGVHEGVDVGHVLGFDFDDPAIAVGVGVDGGSILEGGVELDDLTLDGHQKVGNGLHGLDATEGLASLDGVAFAGDVDKDDVAQLVLCIVSDTNESKFAFNSHPFVVLGVLQICRNVHVVM